MKKWIFFLLLFILVMIEEARPSEVMIPREAIRFRVVANSDRSEDQKLKEEVRNVVQNQMTEDLKDTQNIQEARKVLQQSLPNYKDLVQKTLDRENFDTAFEIHYGENAFPEKTYKGVTYQSGDYESLVITIGDGLGKNWWCVLFPPLCLLEAEETMEKSEVEYKFWIQEMIEKYL